MLPAPLYDDHELYAHGVLLVAEVVSPGSGHDDREFKRDAYARGRVPLYLLIDPQQEEKSATLFIAARSTGAETPTAARTGGSIPSATASRPRARCSTPI